MTGLYRGQRNWGKGKSGLVPELEELRIGVGCARQDDPVTGRYRERLGEPGGQCPRGCITRRLLALCPVFELSDKHSGSLLLRSLLGLCPQQLALPASGCPSTLSHSQPPLSQVTITLCPAHISTFLLCRVGWSLWRASSNLSIFKEQRAYTL